jgi:hypothetical protein
MRAKYSIIRTASRKSSLVGLPISELFLPRLRRFFIVHLLVVWNLRDAES